MDLVTTAILAAVTARVAPELTEGSKKAIEEAYDGLKGLIREKCVGESELVEAVDKLEQRPESAGRRETLKEEVERANAEKDPEILAAAQALLEKIQAQPGGEQHIRRAIGSSGRADWARYASRTATLGLYAYYFLMAVVMLYGLFQFLPPLAGIVGQAGSPDPVTFFLWTFSISGEAILLISVTMAGALGGLIRGIWRLNEDVGKQEYKLPRWLPSYYSKPVKGAILGLIFYLVLRGGFFAPGASVDETNPYAFIGLAGLVGLFSDHAMEKLKQISGSVFAQTEREKEIEKKQSQTTKQCQSEKNSG
jgi:hypothetical protein